MELPMGLSWDCHETPTGLPYGSMNCRGSAMGLPWDWYGTGMGMPWACHGTAMSMLPWGCHETTMEPNDISWQFHGASMAPRGTSWNLMEPHGILIALTS